LGSNDHYGDIRQTPGNAGEGGVFKVYGNKILACPEYNTSTGAPELYLSTDYGATFTQVTSLPKPSYGGWTTRYHFPRVIEHDGTRWWVYAYWYDNRTSARYSSADDGATWTSYPWPSDPDAGTAYAYSYGEYGFTLDGGDNFVHLSRYMDGDDGTATANNWCGLARKDLYTGVFGANLPIAYAANGALLKKLTSGYFCTLYEIDGAYHAYFIDSTIATKSTGETLPGTGFYGAVASDDTVLFSASTGGVYQWSAPGSTFTELTLTGRYSAAPTLAARTMVAKKSDMWLAMSVKEGESTARLFHSTDADGTTWSSTYITLNLPAVVADGAPYVELQAGEDGYWYGCMYSSSGSGNERLFKFEYEARVGDCP
jgi:hypothetical protein